MKQKERAKAEVSKIRDKPIKGEAIYTNKHTIRNLLCLTGITKAKEKKGKVRWCPVSQSILMYVHFLKIFNKIVIYIYIYIYICF